MLLINTSSFVGKVAFGLAKNIRVQIFPMETANCMGQAGKKVCSTYSLVPTKGKT